MSLWNKITEGLVKAAMMRASADKRRVKKAAENPRYLYSPDRPAFHGKRCLTGDERDARDLLVEGLKRATTNDEREALLAEMAKLPVQAVRVQRHVKVDRSRYSGERLREIRKKGEYGTSRARRAMADPHFAAAA